jgi:NAD(P)-dependent dehydrogenase (short-subunit alcohol dehydrogenase family)
MQGLAGRRALVTGGATGIGRAIALRLARAGCDIALLDIDARTANATAAEIRALGREAAAATGDVSNVASVRAARALLADKGAPIDSSTMPALRGSARC